jgi:hypothetical protein
MHRLRKHVFISNTAPILTHAMQADCNIISSRPIILDTAPMLMYIMHADMNRYSSIRQARPPNNIHRQPAILQCLSFMTSYIYVFFLAFECSHIMYQVWLLITNRAMYTGRSFWILLAVEGLCDWKEHGECEDVP